MQNLFQHIEQLLTKHECVIVPELGGFVIYNEQAKTHKNKLLAPSKKVRFNNLLSYHDGLLAEAIMKDRKLDYSSSLAAIRSEVEEIKANLERGNCVTFGQMGKFVYNNENLVFHQDSHSFLPDNIALPTVLLIKINRELTNTSGDKKNIVIQLPESGSKLFKYAASIAIIFLLTLFAPSTNEQSHKATLAFDSLVLTSLDIQVPQIEEQIPPLSTSEIIYTDLDNSTITEAVIEEDTHTTIEAVIEESYKYHIIVASLTSETSAQQYITEKSSSTLQIVEKDNKFRISEQGFHSYKEALLYFNTVKGGKDAWILCL